MDNPRIIHAPMNGRRYSVTAPITQYDYGYLLLPEGTEELPATYEIDFSNDEHKGTSLAVYGGAEGAEVPEELIRTGKDVFAFYYKVGDGYGKTEFTWRLPNKCRPSRDGQTPTPSQQSSIDQLIVRSNEAVTSAEQSASEAGQSAQSAQGYAEQAETARDTAQTYANNASASATSASQSATASANSATASAQSASQSAQIKSDVEDLVDDARGYASASAQSATASANSASQAHGYAQSASASAQSASGYASNAQTSANTASDKASEASTSAQTASNKASEASQSASQALTYKTDAESAKTASQTAQGLAESARDLAQGYAEDAQGYAEDAQGYAEDAQASAEDISASASQIAQNTANILKAFPTDTASGAIASFSDGADDLPLKSLVVDINPVQDLSHGDPSPENICPISGWTSVGVNQFAVNVWDEEWEVGNINPNTGINQANPNTIRSKNYIPCKGNAQYNMFLPWAHVFYYDSGKQFIMYRGNAVTEDGNIHAKVMTTPSNAAFMRFRCTVAYGTTYNHDISINYPSTDHDYHPYTGRSITIPLGQTVYGGKLDVMSGVLTVDRAMVVYDGSSDETWERHSSGSASAFAMKISLVHAFVSTNANIISNYLTAISSSATWGNFDNWVSSSSSGVLNTGIKSITDVETWRTYLASNPLEVCYTLATPLTIQLTPQQVNSLLGVNNIWADSGDTEVEYRADTKLYIERLTAPDSADMVADSNITSGQYFMVGNSLYKATANIANGAQIIVGTNCIRKSLSEALNEINA